ncbi:MAG: carboxypeptidase regulatory-like domain-containing protein, partial [Thermoanaerobaculia bacterium]
MTRSQRHIAPARRVATAALAGLLGVLPLAASPAPESDSAGPAAGSSAAVADAERSAAGVFGQVLGDVDPLSSARVYAYQLADLTLRRVTTNEEGRFRFPDLPAGLYKIIAHKPGFVPAVIMLTRASHDANQFLELELAAQEAVQSSGAEGEDFWAVRDRIPPDVLRDLTAPAASGSLRLADSPFAREELQAEGRFATEIDAMTGVEQLPVAGEALVAGGQVGLEGTMGGVQVGLTGDYWRLGPAGAFPEESADGRMREIALHVDGGPARVDLSTRNQRLVGTDQEPVDLEAHRLTWKQELGETARAHLSAQYTSQTNYYSQSAVAPLEIPRDSSSWEVEGSYTMDATERASFQAGVRYRDRAVGVATADAFGDDDPTLHDERLDLFGRAGLRVQPAVLVEYGLYTTLRDGSLSLVPQGGLVLQLGEDWQASTLVSHKVSTDGQPGPRDFVPTFYHESSACTQGEESCYKV